MLRILIRRSNDVAYFTSDHALELEGVREGGPGWWLRGDGDTRSERDVAKVLTGTERSLVQGYDLIFAAPRPISILVALDPEHARGIVDAHRASVDASVGYLEERALIVRDRRGGMDRDERGRWRDIVSFTHGINRHGEPHLHDHVLVGARAEGARTVLDSRALFAHAATADALYRSTLRYELAQRSPWTAWRSFQGIEHVAGLDEGYRAIWGGHFAERGEKTLWRRDQVVATWASDASRFQAMGTIASPVRGANALDEHSFAGSFEGSFGVTRRQIVQAWANAARFGQGASGITRAIDDLYPELRESRGVREVSVSIVRARMTGHVRRAGPRPLESEALRDWHHLSRERPGPSLRSDRSDRSR